MNPHQRSLQAKVKNRNDIYVMINELLTASTFTGTTAEATTQIMAGVKALPYITYFFLSCNKHDISFGIKENDLYQYNIN